jgi:alpha-mannosidase
VPLKGVFYDGKKGTAPLSQKGISLSKKGILVTAYGKNRDGDGTVLRLWEKTGEKGQVKITLPKGNNFKKAYPCNLRGEISDKTGMPVINNIFETEINAYQPVSFVLK